MLAQVTISLLSIIMLLLAVPPIWPIGYYMLLRIVVCVSSAYLSLLGFNMDKKSWGWIFIVIAVLFNPIAPIYLKKDIWVVIDIIAAIIFAVSIFYLRNCSIAKDNK
jgi:hypothetical protein